MSSEPGLSFRLEKTDPACSARAGRVWTPHGELLTPVFMPVGTLAAVKTLSVQELEALGAQILLGNTYHLLLRPGREVFEGFGGIHKFMGWKRPVLTDSGGFQIFSLPRSRKLSEAGAVFQSYLEGKTWELSPEGSIAMQNAIGSDIMMVLDHCVPGTAARDEAQAAMDLTHRWALRCLEAHRRGRSSTGLPQALFAIVQGGVHTELRRASAEFLRERPFDGYAIGGLAVGETRAEREEQTARAAELLPAGKPRYLMGVGTPLDLLEAVRAGVDLFDCVIPTKLAQLGKAYTSKGELNLLPGEMRLSDAKLDADCACWGCESFSRGYLHHLLKCRESLGWRALAFHNSFYYQRLMAGMRAAVLEGRFLSFRRDVLSRWEGEPTPAPGRDDASFAKPLIRRPSL